MRYREALPCKYAGIHTKSHATRVALFVNKQLYLLFLSGQKLGRVRTSPPISCPHFSHLPFFQFLILLYFSKLAQVSQPERTVRSLKFSQISGGVSYRKERNLQFLIPYSPSGVFSTILARSQSKQVRVFSFVLIILFLLLRFQRVHKKPNGVLLFL